MEPARRYEGQQRPSVIAAQRVADAVFKALRAQQATDTLGADIAGTDSDGIENALSDSEGIENDPKAENSQGESFNPPK